MKLCENGRDICIGLFYTEIGAKTNNVDGWTMILLGLGGNLDSPEFGTPAQNLDAALALLAASGVRVAARSPFYRSAPVPPSDQPWFVNGVAHIETPLAPHALLALLHRIEARIGRIRGERWAARIIDLDLLAYGDRVITGQGENGLILPHPRLSERAFVLAPLLDLAPSWRHPISGKDTREMLGALGSGQELHRIDD
jgi:2-amino-4-hydroxy-6-hydroxymethyldihydropteridine diphosphokinase